MRHRQRMPPYGCEHGFTLVELVVTMAAGMIVLLATLTLLDISMQQGAAATDRVEATQRGRTAMEELVQELHSSCVWVTSPPVQQGSDNSNLWFISEFTSAVNPAPLLHWVQLANNGNLMDTTYALSSQTGPPWTLASFNTSTPAGKKLLATNVSRIGGTQPVFQYYQYVNGTLATDSAHQLTSLPLNPTDASNTAEVTIAFAAGPSDNSQQADRTINLNDAAVLEPPPTGNAQCQ